MIHTETFDKNNNQLLGNVKAPNIASRNKTLNQIRKYVSARLDTLTDNERDCIDRVEVYQYDRLVHIERIK